MARKLNHPKATAAWRIWSRVNFAGPNTLRKGAPGRCWVWTGPMNGVGYGRVTINGRLQYPHRAAYEMTTASIPAGLQIDHRCRTRSCLNPAHLEPVTGSENVRRSTAADAARMRAALVTHCPEGHKYDSINTYKGDHGRRCRTCSRDRYRERYANDPEFREQQQTAARERMRARRATQQTNPERTAA